MGRNRTQCLVKVRLDGRRSRRLISNDPEDQPQSDNSEVVESERLGGLLRSYRRVALADSQSITHENQPAAGHRYTNWQSDSARIREEELPSSVTNTRIPSRLPSAQFSGSTGLGNRQRRGFRFSIRPGEDQRKCHREAEQCDLRVYRLKIHE